MAAHDQVRAARAKARDVPDAMSQSQSRFGVVSSRMRSEI
jgi:hypothetical protein